MDVQLFLNDFLGSATHPSTVVDSAGQREGQLCPTGQDSPQLTTGGASQPSHLTMADHYPITRHLRDLSNEELMDLGGALGLRYSHLRNMSRPLLNDMVAE